VDLEVHEVDRPPADVFRFIAADHVRNDPRWIPMRELEQMTDGPIRVADRAFGMVIRDAPVEMRSRVLFEPEGESGTRLSGILDIPSATALDRPRADRASLHEMKRLIESET
jgi:hypothetical protein